MADASDPVVALAKQLYADAWGKKWPHKSSGTISMEDILPGAPNMLQPNEFGDDDDRINPADDPDDEDSTFPTDWEYTCLHKMNSVVMACGGAGVVAVQDVLVVRPEYVWLEKTIESGYLAPANAVVVTGQPGIGKTAFLLYLLLSRLERRLPTVIQLSSHMIVAFDDRGVFVEPSDTFINLKGYLALMDSNSDSVNPAPAFLWSQPRIIQAAPPETNRWGRWAKESSAEVVISALPTPLEIGAVVKASGLDYAQAGRLIHKWGPCTRTILELIGDGGEGSLASREQALFAKAHAAAVSACENTFAFCDMDQLQRAHSIGTSLVFIHPRRPRDPATSAVFHSASCFSYMPTVDLLSIFNKELRKLVNNNPGPFSVQGPHSVFQSMRSARGA